MEMLMGQSVYVNLELGVKTRTGDFLRWVHSGCISELILWVLIFKRSLEDKAREWRRADVLEQDGEESIVEETE